MKQLRYIALSIRKIRTDFPGTKPGFFSAAYRSYLDARMSYLKTALGADEKTMEGFKQSFEAAAKEFKAADTSGNEAQSKAGDEAAQMRTLANKVQKKLKEKERDKIFYEDIAARYKTVPKPPSPADWIVFLELVALRNEISAITDRVTRMVEAADQAEQQLETLRSSVNGAETEAPKKDDKGPDDKDKGPKGGETAQKDTEEEQKQKDDGRPPGEKKTKEEKKDEERKKGEKNEEAEKEEPQQTEDNDAKEKVADRAQEANKLEQSNSGSWLGKAVGGVAATLVTLVVATGLTLTVISAAAAGGATISGGGTTVLAGSAAITVAAEEVEVMVQEHLEKAVVDAMLKAAPRPPAALPNIQVPILATKRSVGPTWTAAQKRDQGSESPGYKRWKAAALMQFAEQGVQGALDEALKQAVKEMENALK